MASYIQNDLFSNLPVELATCILCYLSPGDLLSAIKASPRLANVFTGNRDRVLRLHLQNFYNHFGQIDAVPLIQFLSELRSIRQQHETMADIKKHSQPIHDALTALESYEHVQTPERWRLNLSTLIKAEVLIPEMRETFTCYREIGWKVKWLALDHVPERLTWMFAKTYLRFECSCTMFDWRTSSLEAWELRSKLERNDDPELKESDFWSFSPHECLEFKYDRLFDGINDRLEIDHGPFTNEEYFDYLELEFMHYRLPLSLQGYPHYLYVMGLASTGDWELEKYLVDLVLHYRY